MKQLGAHVWEDLKRFWVAISLFSATLVLGAIAGPRLGNENLSSPWLTAFLLRPIACWGLVYLLVRARVGRVGTGREYWRNLIPASLSLVLFITVPLFASQMAILSGVEISPGDWLLALLWRQLAFACYFILPVFALTLATRNLIQFVIAVALLCLSWMAASETLGNGRFRFDQDGMDWRLCGLIIFVGAGAVIVMRGLGVRRSAVWSVICIAGILCWLAFNKTPWRYLAPREWFAKERIGTGTIHLEFDRSRKGTRPKERPPGNAIEVVIPVRLTVNAKDLEVEEYRSSFTIVGKSGSWHSGWLNWNAFKGLGDP